MDDQERAKMRMEMIAKLEFGLEQAMNLCMMRADVEQEPAMKAVLTSMMALCMAMRVVVYEVTDAYGVGIPGKKDELPPHLRKYGAN